uniref:Uncharacterized protein TCIL3000_9_730 n=1 Tax=Trypanosoma congolense (strain IL3000) TaxID=1068625 RepID=G0UTG5_TRYCI|nr:unnamed protein product [Trypanosoma congolense IL3000]
MGRYGAHDVYVTPLVRDFPICFPMLVLCFGVYYAVGQIYPRLLGDAFRRLPRGKRDDVVVRTVSIYNGVLMIGSAVCFLMNLHANNYHLDDDVYREIPYYRFFRVSIVAYFVWDVIICFAHKWSMAWKIHALTSLLGSYMLSFPFSDQYGSYYTGMFELSNIPLHASSIIRILNIPSFITAATACEFVFAFLFVIIRVIGGTYVTLSWLRLMLTKLMGSWRSGSDSVHDEFAVVFSMALIFVLQVLQYVWFGEIVKQIKERFFPQRSSKLNNKRVE